MKNLFTTLAITGVGAALAVGAQAQTSGPTNTTGNSGIYTLAVLQNTTQLAANLYQYSYLVTLTADSSKTDVTQFSINNIQGYVNGSAGAIDPTPGLGSGNSFSDFAGNTPIATTTSGFTSLSFGATTGLSVAGTAPAYTFGFPDPSPALAAGNGDSEVFVFDSTLPPGGTVSLGSNGLGGTNPVEAGVLSGTGGSKGPGALATVPETSSFALLGLGLLPLALVARRRLARSN